MPLALPTTGDDQVAQFQSEWQAAYDGASQEHLEGAKCRLIWALVHAAASRRHLQRGLELAEAALETDVRTPDEDRELRYYAAGERERERGEVEGAGLVWCGGGAGLVWGGRGRMRAAAGARRLRGRQEEKGEGREGSFPTATPRWRLWRAPTPCARARQRRHWPPPIALSRSRRQSATTAAAHHPTNIPERSNIPKPPPCQNAATSKPHKHDTTTATTTTTLIVAVAMYNLGDYLRARRALADLLERHPDCRQAAALQEEVTDLVVRNGLLGLGLFGGLVGLGVGLLAATAKRR